MKQGVFTISENRALTGEVYRLTLRGDTSAMERPGQFVNLALPGYYLRRPISVCDWDGESLTLIYKLLGAGTRTLSGLPRGTALDVLTGLGNGYDLSPAGPTPLLAGGGVGIPPLYRLARELLAAGARPVCVLGFKRREEIFLTEEFAALGAEVIVTTEDGSLGVQGYVTAGFDRAGTFSHVYACGPEAMLRAVDLALPPETGAQFSFEERMGCGFGACMGCTRRTAGGWKRVCRDGPVFFREEVLW